MRHLTDIVITVGGVELRWNVTGVNSEGVVDPEKFSIRLFTVDYERGLGGFDAPLDMEAVSRLHNFLAPFVESKERLSGGGFRVVETDSEVDALVRTLTEQDARSLTQLFSELNRRGGFEGLVENIDALDAQQLEFSIRNVRRKSALRHLKKLVEVDCSGSVVAFCEANDEFSIYRAGQPETVFQRWFELNEWVLGREYVKRHSARRIGIDSVADFVMETADGFLDLIELKRPNSNLLTSKGNPGDSSSFYYPHSEFSQAYGQCVRYLSDLEDFRLQLERKYGAKVVAPRVFLIVGRRPVDELERDTLRRIVANYHQIEVISYDQMLAYGARLLSSDDTGEGALT